MRVYKRPLVNILDSIYSQLVFQARGPLFFLSGETSDTESPITAVINCKMNRSTKKNSPLACRNDRFYLWERFKQDA